MKIRVGIDIGGTNTKVGVVDKEGNIRASSGFKTASFNSENDFLNVLKQHIKNLLSKDDFELDGIGIGAPNGNFFTGKIENAPNLKWGQNVEICKILEKEFSVPVKITNDANAAAIGEQMFGKGRGMKNFIEITLGTGLGSGFIVDGKIMLGHDGFAGEMGHMTVVPHGRLCGCGRYGCLETYASATGLKTSVLELLNVLPDNSLLRQYNPSKLEAVQIYDAAVRGDKLALQAFDFTAKMLGRKLADVVALFSPEAVFFFGGLAEAGDLLIKNTKKYMEESLMPIFRNKVKLEQSGLLGKNAAILGASALLDFEL